MIFFRLTRAEAEIGPLPAVCIRCGAPAFVWQSKRLRWRLLAIAALYAGWPTPAFMVVIFMLLAGGLPLELEKWLGLSGAIIFALGSLWFVQRTIQVRLPFCERHYLHWFKWSVFHAASTIFVVSSLAAMVWFPLWLNLEPGPGVKLQRWLALIVDLHIVVWLVVTVVGWCRALQVNEISDKGITLRGVHPRFREAVLQQRHEQREKTRQVHEPSQDSELQLFEGGDPSTEVPNRSPSA